MHSAATNNGSWRVVALAAWAILAPIVAITLLCLVTRQFHTTAISGNMLLLCDAIGGAFAFFMRTSMGKRFLVFCIYFVFSAPVVFLLGLQIWCGVSGNCL